MKFIKYCYSVLQFRGLYGEMYQFSPSGEEEVEILVVDDGSSDRTAQIADEYAEKYPTIVRALHQENSAAMVQR